MYSPPRYACGKRSALRWPAAAGRAAGEHDPEVGHCGRPTPRAGTTAESDLRRPPRRAASPPRRSPPSPALPRPRSAAPRAQRRGAQAGAPPARQGQGREHRQHRDHRRSDDGGRTIASSGSSAPTVKARKLAPAACHGFASSSGSMPSSTRAWARSASRSVSCSRRLAGHFPGQAAGHQQPGQLLEFRLRLFAQLAPLHGQRGLLRVALGGDGDVLARRHRHGPGQQSGQTRGEQGGARARWLRRRRRRGPRWRRCRRWRRGPRPGAS